MSDAADIADQADPDDSEVIQISLRITRTDLELWEAALTRRGIRRPQAFAEMLHYWIEQSGDGGRRESPLPHHVRINRIRLPLGEIADRPDAGDDTAAAVWQHYLERVAEHHLPGGTIQSDEHAGRTDQGEKRRITITRNDTNADRSAVIVLQRNPEQIALAANLVRETLRRRRAAAAL